MKNSPQSLIERARRATVDNAFMISMDVRGALMHELPSEVREQLELLLVELEEKIRKGPWMGGSTIKV